MKELTWAEIKAFQARIDETLIALAQDIRHGAERTEEYNDLMMSNKAISAYKSARSKAQHAAKKAK